MTGTNRDRSFLPPSASLAFGPCACSFGDSNAAPEGGFPVTEIFRVGPRNRIAHPGRQEKGHDGIQATEVGAPWHRFIGSRPLALVGLLLALALPVGAVDDGGQVAPVVATNTVLVTNVVVINVTNVIVTTNVVRLTNASPAAPGAASLQASNAPASTLPDLSWVPPRDRFDWIQLKSGEWLKGRIKGMQDRELDFDSEEMDDQKFDWKDIRQLRSPRILDVLFITREQVSGPVSVTPTQVTVGDATPTQFPRTELQSLTPGGDKELNRWSGKFSLGLTLRGGNTEQLDYTAQANLQRRTPSTRFRFDYLGNFSSVEGVENANNHRVTPEFNVWLSRRFFLVVPYAEYYRDPFQNIAHRATLGVGVGYDLIDHKNLEWSVTTGPAYQYSWFDSVQPGEPTEQGAAALVLSTRFDWDITRKVECLLEYRGTYTSREVGETTHHAVGTLSIDVTKRLELDVSLTWDRISNPKVGADGVQPKPDDVRLVVSFGVDF